MRSLLMLAQSLIGCGFFFLYVQHVRLIFESRTNINNLSPIERETLLRREDAIYYSFYKIIIEESDFWSGFEKLKNISDIEYPESVNALHSFEVLPELAIGYGFHFIKRISTPCWQRGDIIISNEYENQCDKSAQAMQFYLEFVWILGGFTVLVLYLLGILLCENTFGGIYAVLSYLLFHKHASKIYDRPMARANFSFPFILFHTFCTCMCIRNLMLTKKLYSRHFLILKLAILTSISLLTWKFSCIIFAFQIFIMMLPWTAKSVSTDAIFSLDFAISQLMGMFIAYYFSFENKQYLFSWQLGPTLALAFFSGVRVWIPCKSRSKWQETSFQFIMASSLQINLRDFFEYINIIRPKDDSFLFYRDMVFHWLFDIRDNFATRILLCNASNDRITFGEMSGLLETLIIKPYCMYGVVVLGMFFRKNRKQYEIRKNMNTNKIKQAKDYALEDFLKEKKISINDMYSETTKEALEEFLVDLKRFDYNYDLYKADKLENKKNCKDELNKFINDVKSLKTEIIAANEKMLQNAMENKKEECEAEDLQNIMLNINPEKPIKSTRPSKTKHISYAPSKRFSRYSFNFLFIYIFMQMAFFTILGLNVKELFFLCFTEGCVLAPVLCSKILSKSHRRLYWMISMTIFGFSFFSPGVENIRNEYQPSERILSENELKPMLEWININTEKNAIFAGPVDIIGTVHLVTRRPIVNHSYLDMKQSSERTQYIYSVYSRQKSTDVFNKYSQYKVQYLIISLNQCNNQTRYICDPLSIWDAIQPTLWNFPQFCSDLISKNVPSFLQVYSNKDYAIIKMFSESVQLNLKTARLEEKCM